MSLFPVLPQLTGTNALFAALVYLTVKHWIADYVLQTRFMFANKGIYGHPGGFLHALIHVVFTAPVFLILPAHSPQIAALVLGGEAVIHYHMDWLKEALIRAFKLTNAGGAYWSLFGLDQLVHSLTYLAIAYILFTY